MQGWAACPHDWPEICYRCRERSHATCECASAHCDILEAQYLDRLQDHWDALDRLCGAGGSVLQVCQLQPEKLQALACEVAEAIGIEVPPD